MKTLEIKVSVRRLPLSAASARAVRACARHDLVVCTSRHAERFFLQALRERGVSRPPRGRMVRVGPRAELLKLPLRGKRILFPRSAIAPFDIVRRMRARGATVRVVPLYTADRVLLPASRKRALRRGEVEKLFFRSPSGVLGLLRHFSRDEWRTVLTVPAGCIGATTARAARAAGFKHVTVQDGP